MLTLLSLFIILGSAALMLMLADLLYDIFRNAISKDTHEDFLHVICYIIMFGIWGFVGYIHLHKLLAV